MLASDVARHIVAHYGDAWFLTNLKLNLLVYWCQVGALRDAGAPLFADEIAVGECGPVIPAIWAEYEAFGSRMIRLRDEWQVKALGENTESLVARQPYSESVRQMPDTPASSPQPNWE